MLISVKDIIIKSIDLYKQNHHIYLQYMLLLFMPTGVVAIYSAFFGSIEHVFDLYGFGLIAIIYILLIIIGSLLSIWISIAFIKTIAQTVNQEKLEPIAIEMEKAKKLILPAIIASLLTTLAVIGGTVLFIVPGIIFGVWFAFAIYSVAIDNTEGVNSLHRSRELVQGRWWEVFWRLLAPGIFFAIGIMIIQQIINWPLEFLLKSLEHTAFWFSLAASLVALINVLVGLIITPLTTTAPTILFLELKKTPTIMKHPTPSKNVPHEPPLK